jgi:integrase
VAAVEVRFRAVETVLLIDQLPTNGPSIGLRQTEESVQAARRLPCGKQDVLVGEPIHQFGASSQNRAKFSAVDDLCGSCARVARKPGDLLDWHAVGREQGHEGLAKLLRCPVSAEGCGVGHRLELPADVASVELRTKASAEDAIGFTPQLSGIVARLILPIPMFPQELSSMRREAERAPRQRRVSGPSKAAVQDELKELRKGVDAGLTKPAPPTYTVRRCCEDWLADGLPGRDLQTVEKNRYVLEPVLTIIGTTLLRDLDVADVDRALTAIAATRSSSTVAIAHLALTRAITRAQAKNLVLRNVSALTGTPPGQEGRPSRSMTLAQANALCAAAKAVQPRTYAYVMLSLCTGVRTEEARALRWEHVDLGDPDSSPPRLASVAVWRSVRAKGDTKTRKSRRTLALPQRAVAALQALRDESGHDPGDLVFRTATGRAMDAGNVRRSFRARSARQRVSDPSGRPGSCGTPSSASCPTVTSPLMRSPGSSVTPAAKSPSRFTATNSGLS